MEKIFFNILISLLLCCITDGYAAQFCTRIPYRIEGEKMMLRAKVNGIEGNFIFDTGAPVCLSRTFAARLGVSGGKEVSFQDSNGQNSTGEVLVLDALTLGNVTFSQVECALFEKGSMIESFGVDGVIGYTLFGDKMVEINGRKNQITVSDSRDYFSLNPAWANRMLPGNFVPWLEVKLGDRQMDTVMFDSGAEGFYEISEKSFQRMKNSDAFRVLDKGHGILSFGAAGLEDKTTKYRIEVPDFYLGNEKFKRVTSITTQGDSRLGSEVLKYGIVTIDYPEHKLYFQPFSTEVPDMYRKEWNVIVTVMDNHLTAGFIWESMQNQLEGGERIVEINGKRFDKVDAYQAMTTNMIDLSGGKAEIVVIDKKSGKERKVEIHQN